MRIIYQALCWSVIQHGLLVWGECATYVLRPLEVQHNLIVRICQDKRVIKDSAAQNYKQLKVFLVKFLCKQFFILFWSCQISIKK